MVISNNSHQHTYVKIERMELGAGWGGRRYKVLLAFSDPALLKKAQTGKWICQMGAEASAGRTPATKCSCSRTAGPPPHGHSAPSASKPYRD